MLQKVTEPKPAEEPKKPQKKKTSASTWLLTGALILGIGFLLYPTVSDYWNSFHQSRAIAGYVESVTKIDNSEFEALWKDADLYNESLLSKDNRYVLSEEETEQYNNLLNITDTGIMAYVEIPKIRVSLPIYHGTDEAVLQVAIGHIPGSSLPVGGESTHCVISGHRGLPSARLFTDIDQLDKGDIFTIQTLGETLTYEVDQIRTVLPTELEDIEIEEGKDYVTLVTCTPYGVNSHRLLVRGHRTANAKDHLHVTPDAVQVSDRITAFILAIVIILVLLVVSAVQQYIQRH